MDGRPWAEETGDVNLGMSKRWFLPAEGSPRVEDDTQLTVLFQELNKIMLFKVFYE